MSAPAPVITVDGPSGVGKGTLCQYLAQQLGWNLLDSGALYRLTALAAQRRNLPLDAQAQVAQVAAQLNVTFTPEAAGALHITLDGVAVGNQLRSETTAAAASQIAALPQVRAALLQRQRAFRQFPGLIADGRDMGTVVFPDAPLKLFLSADPVARATRRHKQLITQGIDASLDQLIEQIAERDARDMQRAIAPLRAAADAEILDTSTRSIAEVCAWGLQLAQQRCALRAIP